MNIGLYMLKFPFRKMISFLIPFCKNISPNLISLLLIPIGVLMAYIYYLILNNGQIQLLLFVIVLAFIRMVVATLDGLVAITYLKSSAKGDILNRLTPELCDMLLYPTIISFYFSYKILAILSFVFCWATPFFGLLGTPSQCPVQSVGPVGQTDRLVALMIFTLLEFFNRTNHWNLDFFKYFLYWIVIGGTITLIFRLYRNLKEAELKDAK